MSLSDRFIRLACVNYEDWRRPHLDEARQLLGEHPDLARTDLYAAAAANDAESVRAMLAADPSLANRKGGPYNWEPLLYACYSRIDSGDAVATVRALLDAGANPNAQFLFEGLPTPFTAVTGAFGGGEDALNEPPHPHRDAIARLLLEAGANPNDDQTLYNLHFGESDDHLEMLLEYGLNDRHMLIEQLWFAARAGRMSRVKLLVEAGADVNAPGVRDGRTPWESATRMGQDAVAAYLVEHGAKPVELPIEERFAIACINGRGDAARAIVAGDPGIVQRIGFHRRIEMLHRAVEARRLEGIRLMSDLGFELSEKTTHDNAGLNLGATALHNAAWIGDMAMVKLLLELGADPNARDPNYNGTPLDWAEHNDQREAAELLRAVTA